MVPNGEATAVVVDVPKPPVVAPNGEPKPKPAGFACVVAGVEAPNIDVVAVVAAGVPPKLNVLAGVVVAVVPNPPKPVGLACCC